jgi:type IV secretory pathway VirB4 component
MGSESDNRIAFFARTNFRNDRRLFGIRQADRRAHMYVIGKTGTGKSTLLETLIRT